MLYIVRLFKCSLNTYSDIDCTNTVTNIAWYHIFNIVQFTLYCTSYHPSICQCYITNKTKHCIQGLNPRCDNAATIVVFPAEALQACNSNISNINWVLEALQACNSNTSNISNVNWVLGGLASVQQQQHQLKLATAAASVTKRIVVIVITSISILYHNFLHNEKSFTLLLSNLRCK